MCRQEIGCHYSESYVFGAKIQCAQGKFIHIYSTIKLQNTRFHLIYIGNTF